MAVSDPGSVASRGRIGLVGCVKSKLDHVAPAGELYTSDLFLGRKAYVERSCGRTFSSVAVELAAMVLVNLSVVVALQVLERVLGLIDSPAPVSTTLFIIFLVTVITVLFDRYRTVYMARRMLEDAGGEVAPHEGRPA